MNFKEIIKEEWEKEYQTSLEQEPYNIEDSIFSIYHELVERICVRVWNQAVWESANNAEIDYKDKSLETFVDKESILKLIINEQGTDTTEV